MRANLLLATAIAAASSMHPIMSSPQARATDAGTKDIPALPHEGTLPDFAGATTWLDSPPLTAEGLRGKVVVVDFLTYTCINWQRTQPYLRAWAEKYKDEGLVVIGVHTPEFEFEKSLDNVRPGLALYRVEYPVAVDSNSAIWRAFDNHYWPAVYIADATGAIRYHQFGEGDYERQEAVIRQLLREAGYPGKGKSGVEPRARGSEVAAASSDLRSSETYVGADRAEGFVSTRQPGAGGRHTYVAARSLALNQWSLAGPWTVGPAAITLDKPDGRIVYRFHARDLNLVMGPSTRGSAVRFRVRIDGRPPGTAHGEDVDAEGNGVVTFPRLYQLIRQPKPIADRVFEIEFLDPGVDAFAFTFG